jgi:hypothetical protein
MINAPLKKSPVYASISAGDAIGVASGAASNVENRHGKKR